MFAYCAGVRACREKLRHNNTIMHTIAENIMNATSSEALILICGTIIVQTLTDAVICSSAMKYLDFAVSLLRVLLGLNILLAQAFSLVLQGC